MLGRVGHSSYVLLAFAVLCLLAVPFMGSAQEAPEAAPAPNADAPAQNPNLQTRPAAAAPDSATANGELLTPEQIQKLKFAEFLGRQERRSPLPRATRRARPGQPAPPPPPGVARRTSQGLREEFLQVRFEGDVLNLFLDRMSGHTDFSAREDRTAFLSLSPTRQTQLIREHTGNAYQDRINIINDPLVFRQFERVLPMVLSGCATSACHGGPQAQGWRLRTARPRTDLNLYSNFIVLSHSGRGNQRLIDRAKPQDSLLLQYGLPLRQATFQHPQVIPVVYPRGFDDVRYQTILTWIESLTIPEPRTGVTLPGYPEPPPPQIGGTPAPAQTAAPAAP